MTEETCCTLSRRIEGLVFNVGSLCEALSLRKTKCDAFFGRCALICFWKRWESISFEECAWDTCLQQVSDEGVWKFQCWSLLVMNNDYTLASIVDCKNFVLKSTYHGFNFEDCIKFSPEGSTWLSFLAFCKFSLPSLYESILKC